MGDVGSVGVAPTSMTMTVEERVAFLAEDGHVGVISIEREGSAPLSVPLWYRYEPGGDVWTWIQRGSVKEVALREAQRFTLVAQSEEYFCKYVSVEGPVVGDEGAPTCEQLLGIVRRYVPDDEVIFVVDAYQSAGQLTDDASVLIRMHPERWLGADHSKAAG
jgi:hypothetical protein